MSLLHKNHTHEEFCRQDTIKDSIRIRFVVQAKPFPIRVFLVEELSNDETNIFVELLSKVPNSILREEIVTVKQKQSFSACRIGFVFRFKLLPILIRSLSFSNETVWLSALNSIADLIESQPLIIVEHLESLLPRLMNLATTQNSMVERKSEENQKRKFRFDFRFRTFEFSV